MQQISELNVDTTINELLNSELGFLLIKKDTKNEDVYGRELATMDELAELEAGHGILLMAGTKPFYSELYDLKSHDDYKEMWEAWVEQDGTKE